MAEIAIPIMALGGFYIISKHNKNKQKEQFTVKDETQIPSDDPVEFDDFREFQHPNQTTDKFFEPVSTTNKNRYMSLTGESIDAQDFQHNNMVPFFGSKSHGGNPRDDLAENRLDYLQGSGSQTIKKEERAPLFKPQENIQYAYGAPNSNDFYQSRVNPSMRMANIKPWSEQRVQPGLNKGYTTGGGNGFNSGVESRNQWMPKTVDQLRVETNPKETFSLNGHQGPALSSVQETANRQTQGRVEKHSVDTYYSLGKDRWFTTTGIEKASTARGIEMLHPTNRPDTTVEYYGNGMREGEASYATGEYMETKRQVLAGPELPIATATGQRTNDFGKSGFQSLPNNRTTTKSAEEYGPVMGAMRAAAAPILDILRPSRKENVIGNLRVTGNAGSTVANAPIYDPSDVAKTTIREMTSNALDGKHWNYQGQKNGDGYLTAKQQAVHVQRDTTNADYTGNPSYYVAPTTYDAGYNNQRDVDKTTVNRINQGGTQIFNQNENVSHNKKANDGKNNRDMMASNGPSTIPSAAMYGNVHDAPVYEELDRINPDLLSAFKKNPYTQSLQSY